MLLSIYFCTVVYATNIPIKFISLQMHLLNFIKKCTSVFKLLCFSFNLLNLFIVVIFHDFLLFESFKLF